MHIDSLRETVFAAKPALKKLVETYGKVSLFDYAKNQIKILLDKLEIYDFTDLKDENGVLEFKCIDPDGYLCTISLETVNYNGVKCGLLIVSWPKIKHTYIINVA